MKKHLSLNLFSLFTLSMLLISACSLIKPTQPEVDTNAVVQTSIAQTQAAMGGDSVVFTSGPTDTIPVPPTETLEPTITLTPTETLTPTLANPQAHVDVNTNCRIGPGELYDIVGALVVGQTGNVVGRYQAGDYWVIDNPNGRGECWIWGFYATLEGPTDNLPYYTQPPTPTPVVDWSGTWVTKYGPVASPVYDITITLNQTNSTVNGSFTFMTVSYTIYGTLSSDYMTLTATWDNGTTTGPLVFHMLNPNQFNGNESNGTNAWCGYRNSAGLPSPCVYP